jgi:tripeptidyl-peptidase-1
MYHAESPFESCTVLISQIADHFAPTAETITSVKAWLSEAGIATERITLSKGNNWIKFDATVEEAESLLKTEYFVYENTATGKDHLACEEYSLPTHIREHVDFITPTTQFDAFVNLKDKRKTRSLDSRELKAAPISNLHLDPEAVPQPELVFSLANCFAVITPDCLRALYGFPNGTLAS